MVCAATKTGPEGLSMSRRVVYLQGNWISEQEARLSIYDSALIAGEIAFEVTRTLRQQPFRLRQHLERLAGSLAVLRLDPGLSLETWEELTWETLRRNLPSEASDIDWQILHQVSRGPAADYWDAFSPEERQPTVWISCFPLVPRLARLARYYTTGVELFVPPQPAIPPELLPTHIKTRGRLHYLLAGLQAAELRPGGWPVLVDPTDHLTEGTSYNVFLVSQGVLRTAPEADVLIGVTRSLILELATELGIATSTDKLPRSATNDADEMFVTATSFGIFHARQWEDRVLGDGTPGPITRRLRDALYDRLGLDFAAQAQRYADLLPNWRPQTSTLG